MSKPKEKKAIIKELRRTPIIQVACEKVGISRQTFYRWKNDDVKFALECEAARKEGRELVNDVAESNVLQGIKEKNFNYTKLWLSNNHDNYRSRLRVDNKGKSAEELLEYQRGVEEAERDIAEMAKRFDPTEYLKNKA